MRFGVFLYDGVEPIDLAVFGVLSMARRVAPAISIASVAPRPGAVALANGLTVQAAHGLDRPPALDALVVLGGPGWQAQYAHAPTLDYLRGLAEQGTLLASACTGGMVLAAAGLLDGRCATTKKEVIAGAEIPPLQLLAERHPAVRAVPARLVDEGTLVTGGGVTLCIDLTLHLIERLLGKEVADETARILEYGAARSANRQAFATLVR